MKSYYLLTIFLCTLLLIGLFSIGACSEAEDEKEIAISDLPAVVVKAVQDSLPGFVISDAEIEGTEPDIIYDVDGSMDGNEYEIEITPEGKILEIEMESDEDEDETNAEDDRKSDQ